MIFGDFYDVKILIYFQNVIFGNFDDFKFLIFTSDDVI